MTVRGLLATVIVLAMLAPGAAQEINPIVVMDTSLGRIKLELFAGKAPVSVKNFLGYVDDKFYEGTIFHRVIDNFMIQGGGLNGDLKEKPARAPIVCEAGNGLSNARGTIAMARAAKPDSATVQFFINVKDNAYLDRANAADKVGYAVFGRVIDGMDVVDKIKKVKTGNRGQHQDVPIEPVLIRSLRRASEFTLAVAGTFIPDKLFTITAYVNYPGRGQAFTLELPPGVERIEGKATQPVAPAASPALVLWKARTLGPGEFTIRVHSNTGVIQSKTIMSLRPNSLLPRQDPER